MTSVPTFHGVGTLLSQEAGSTAWTVEVPPGTAAGDLLLMVLADGTGNTTPIAPGGWHDEEGISGAFSSNRRLTVYWRLAEAGEPASYVVGFSGAEVGLALMARLSGHDPVDPIGVFGMNGEPVGGSSTAPSRNFVEANSLMLCVWHGDGSQGADTMTPPGTMTERWDPGLRFPFVGASEPRPTAGTTGTRTADFDSVSVPSRALTMQIKPGPDALDQIGMVVI